MRWTDMSERDMIKEWAKEECRQEFEKAVFSQPENGIETYWTQYDTDSDIEEFDFETLPQLKAILEEKLSDPFYKDLILPLAVSAFKEKKVIDNAVGNVEGEKENKLEIPEFVYAF